jgi:aspartate/methionine/tyrosine aminotransferase
MDDIAPFYVMELLARARAMEEAGRDVIHMELGEPDFDTPEPIVEAGIAALRAGHTRYTPAKGLRELREAIAESYAVRFGLDIPAQRVIVTPGSSGALLLAMGVLVDPGDQVLLADPGYPCNRHFVRLAEGVPVGVPVTAASAYQLSADLVRRHAGPDTRAVLVGSPSNPTGTVIDPEELRAIHRETWQRDAFLVVDEIYQGLTYGPRDQCALGLGEDLLVVNSFSKYYGMTGWRLGWLVAPEYLVPELDRLAQNIFIAAPTAAQHAALAAFQPATREVLEARREQFRRRRDFLVPALKDLGFRVPVEPQGAFYVYADCSRFTEDSYAFCYDLLDRTGVAVTPGKDFGAYAAERHLRFSYTTGLEQLEKGVERLAAYLE